MLNEDVTSYLDLRHAAGFDLRHAGSVLRRFARYASDRGESHLISSTAVDWSSQARSLGERDHRLKALTIFAHYVHAEDPRHEIPPAGLFGRKRGRTPLFIFSSSDISLLLEKAMHLGPSGSLRPHMYTTLFALLAVTGLRISEALHLRMNDVTADGLLIHKTKFRKNRLVPLHETAVEGLHHYLNLRKNLKTADDHVFVSLHGCGLCYENVRSVFHFLVRAAGIRYDSNRRPPQIHSLRHTFSVRALETCPPCRDQIGEHLLALSTYLGHAHVADTYWYLEATPQLLADIAKTWESFTQGGEK
jgi:integrase/recombinase XerD